MCNISFKNTLFSVLRRCVRRPAVLASAQVFEFWKKRRISLYKCETSWKLYFFTYKYSEVLYLISICPGHEPGNHLVSMLGLHVVLHPAFDLEYIVVLTLIKECLIDLPKPDPPA